jgi:light-regulated signal transduction histidine kinase (bacteriophytochrome)
MDESKNKIEELNSEIKAYKEQLTDFVESAAHDLHAPLRKLSVLMERLITKHEPLFDTDAKEYVNRIQTCITEMKSLVDGLTELARVDAETTGFTACDLNVIVKEMLEMMSEETKGKNAVINIGHLPVIQGNAFQYRQLFKNLFENAIKFNKKNIPDRIDIKTGLITAEEKNLFNLENQKKYYKIEIADNGIGFNQNYAEKIFQPFVRLHSRSKYEGSGLGLAICKKIVMNHKGIIYAEGNENKGSRFVLILPESP